MYQFCFTQMHKILHTCTGNYTFQALHSYLQEQIILIFPVSYVALCIPSQC